jgi:hypothetical protein
MRLLYASLAFQAADAMIPYFLDYSSPSWMKGVAFAITAVASYARLCPQSNLPEEAHEGTRAQP